MALVRLQQFLKGVIPELPRQLSPNTPLAIFRNELLHSLAHVFRIVTTREQSIGQASADSASLRATRSTPCLNSGTD